MPAALVIGGWVTASVALALALLAWRWSAMRMELVARGWHELRGPLAAARLGLQLGERGGELTAAELRTIDLELARAALVLEDLSGVRHALAPTRAREVIEVAELLKDCVEPWRVGAVHKGADLRLQWSGERASVWGDRLRLAQATENLIANAIEHGEGVVEVRGEALGLAIRIEVLDRGRGLPASVAELTRRARAGRGSRGRGLAIAAAVAEDHGGRLAAAPSDHGARLVLELPAVPTGGTAPRPGQD